jgi:hypothetical protein
MVVQFLDAPQRRHSNECAGFCRGRIDSADDSDEIVAGFGPETPMPKTESGIFYRAWNAVERGF